MCHTFETEHYFIGEEMNGIRTDLKQQFEQLARRQSGKYLDHTETAVQDTYAVYFRDREGWVYCWSVEVDENDEIKHAQELLVFDAENAPDAIPSCILEETQRLERWAANMALDPYTDESYYMPTQ